MVEVHYTVFKPNQANMLGSLDLVCVMDNLTDYIVNGVKAGSMFAIGTPNVNTALSFIIFPQVHMVLQGDVIETVGNMSNVQGEFPLVNVRVDALCHASLRFGREAICMTYK